MRDYHFARDLADAAAVLAKDEADAENYARQQSDPRSKHPYLTGILSVRYRTAQDALAAAVAKLHKRDRELAALHAAIEEAGCEREVDRAYATLADAAFHGQPTAADEARDRTATATMTGEF